MIGFSLRRTRFFKDADELTVAPGNFREGGFARRFPGSKVNEWLPEIRPAHREANEAFDSSGRRQPLAHLLIVFATTKNNATHFAPSITVRGRHDLFTVRAMIESLNLPD